MKQTLLTTLLTVIVASAAPCVSAQKSVPYSSDLGINYVVDSEWTRVNNGDRRSKGFEFDGNADCSTPGTTGAVAHKYDSSYAADCWLISPAIALNAGTQYTVSLWTKTRGNTETEKFEICAATSSEPVDLKNGTILMRNENYQHSSDFEKQTMTFTPTVSGNYYFGIHCFSDPDMYDFSVTGFSISGNGGGTPVDPGQNEKILPYEFDFSDADAFAADWTSVSGPLAGVTSPWKHNSYINVAEFEAQGKCEDNWLISPAISFPEAGTYMLNTTCTVYGTMDIAIGSDNKNTETFRTIHAVADAASFEEPYTIGFTVDAPGVYYIGYHVKAASGSYMGYRVHYMKVKADKPVPALITDLKVVPDAEDGLSVQLSWTNSSVDQSGNQIDALTKVELYRNGVMHKEFTQYAAGSEGSFTDLVPQAGVYSYYVLAYNANGAIDSEPVIVSAGFVGHPTAALPFDFSTSSASEEDMAKFTIFDANADSHTWSVVKGIYSTDFQSTQTGTGEADDWLATPYINLEKGYYRMEVNIDARFNSYELGFASSRRNLPGMFVKCLEINNEQNYSYQTKSVVLAIPSDGEYVLAVHHVGRTESSAYPNVKLNRISLSEQALLPGIATELKVSEVEGSDKIQARIEWTNPTIDNAGQQLDPDMQLSIKISRDGTDVVTLPASAEHTPGKAESYIDSTLTEGGEYTYTVEVSNVNGSSEEEVPSASCYIGPALPVPYSVSDFNDWKFINENDNWYKWEVDETSGSASWSKLWGDPENDCLLSPFIQIEANTLYEVTVEALASDGDMEWKLMTGNAGKFESLMNLTSVSTPQGENAVVHTFDLNSSQSMAVMESDTPAEIAIEPGKKTFAIVPSKIGKLTINSFKIEKRESVGVETIYASAGTIEFKNGMIFFADNTMEVRIYDIDGRLICHQASACAIDTSVLPSGMVVVVAVTPEGKDVLKIGLR